MVGLNKHYVKSEIETKRKICVDSAHNLIQCKAEEGRMAYSKISPEEINAAKLRQREWLNFRRKHLFSQLRLAQTLGISRRTVQSIESGYVKRPQPDTLRAFRTLKMKCDAGQI